MANRVLSSGSAEPYYAIPHPTEERKWNVGDFAIIQLRQCDAGLPAVMKNNEMWGLAITKPARGEIPLAGFSARHRMTAMTLDDRTLHAPGVLDRPSPLFMFLAFLLLLGGSQAWAQQGAEYGYLEGRISSIDSSSRMATVVLDGGRVVTADLGQDLPGASSGVELPQYRVGQRVEVYYSQGPMGGTAFAVADWVRRPALLWLTALFLVVSVAVARFKGLRAFVATGFSLAIVILYVLPAMLQGHNPVLVSLLGVGGILLLAIYFVHGINWSTTAAIIGTFFAIIVTMLLGLLWTDLAHLTGFGTEDALLISYQASQVNMRGLILAGMLIGALGALTDITIVQSSVIRELAVTNPDFSTRELYTHGMNVGLDHIGSLVNTLVLAYAGSALPLLMLLQLNGMTVTQQLNLEMVATEVVHTLVGSIGLILAVPLTTFIAALLFRGGRLPVAKGELNHAHHH